ncbi:hypothetical protein G0P98_27435, partial [Yangia sp. PrR004]|nr:hypothetical protein [Salipiger sp. PrR004]
MKVLLLAMMATFVLSAIDTKVTNCMTGTTSIVWTAATFSVEPTKGVNETITLYGDATAHAELANVYMVAYWNGLEAFTDNYPGDDAWDEGDKVTYSLT